MSYKPLYSTVPVGYRHRREIIIIVPCFLSYKCNNPGRERKGGGGGRERGRGGA